MSLPTNYRKILANEMKVYTICQKSFKKQYKFLKENLADLYENYTYNVNLCYNQLQNANVDLYKNKKSREEIEGEAEQLQGFRMEMGVYEMIVDIQTPIEKSVMKAYKKRYRQFAKILEQNGFSYYGDTGSNYAKIWGELNLSNYKGAISYTTKRDVINILKQGYDNNWTTQQVADEIEKISERLFGKARARAIAVTEIGKAYEYGNYQPMKTLSSVGIPIKKLWQTVDDDRVRPEHMDCELEGRVDIDYTYPSVGQTLCPEGVNCRCTMLYKIDD